MKEKRHSPSFLSQCIEGLGSGAEMEFVHKWAALALYLGGADTVSSYASFDAGITLLTQSIDRIVHHDLLPCHDRLPGS